jgi:hypothetical protein
LGECDPRQALTPIHVIIGQQLTKRFSLDG